MPKVRDNHPKFFNNIKSTLQLDWGLWLRYYRDVIIESQFKSELKVGAEISIYLVAINYILHFGIA